MSRETSMKAPLDHVALGYDRICLPPDGKPQIVCGYWPECMCSGECVDLKDVRLARLILIALAIATAAIAAGLIYWSMQ